MPTATRTKLNATKNDLPEATREAAIAILQARLTGAIELQLTAKQAHWNVKGPNFIALHELFDAVYGQAGVWVDTIAERLVALGGIADGRIQTVAKSANSYPLEIQAGADHVDALASVIATFGESVRTGIDESEAVEEPGTVDLFTAMSREVDKQLWFVESHNR